LQTRAARSAASVKPQAATNCRAAKCIIDTSRKQQAASIKLDSWQVMDYIGYKRKVIMKKKINNNDLIPWFTQDHKDLPDSYLKSCQEFFDWLDQCNKKGFQAPSSKQVTAASRCDI
jgi:hypothetical protein